MKKVAVLVRDRQDEALRMSVGITLLDDQIDVFVLDRKLEENEQNTLNIETLKELGQNIYTNFQENTGLEFLSTEEIAKRLLQYDHIIPY
ncbi:MAG: hypothetical protein D6710_05280 [Nitrospirae bacterium]|nr:MAG: hypothetical protein D6710_05280 [Nitrospirota bacterium]